MCTTNWLNMSKRHCRDGRGESPFPFSHAPGGLAKLFETRQKNVRQNIQPSTALLGKSLCSRLAYKRPTLRTCKSKTWGQYCGGCIVKLLCMQLCTICDIQQTKRENNKRSGRKTPQQKTDLAGTKKIHASKSAPAEARQQKRASRRRMCLCTKAKSQIFYVHSS